MNDDPRSLRNTLKLVTDIPLAGSAVNDGDALTRHAFTTLQIGFIVAGNGAPMTGSERYYFDLLRTLPSLGILSRGLVVGDPAAVENPLDTVTSFAREGGGTLSRLRNLRREVRRLKSTSDLVAAHAPAHAWPVLDIIRKKPLVVHFHGPLVLESRAEGKSAASTAKARFAENLTFRRAQRFIVLSQANAMTLQQHYGVREDRIRVIPGAVDTARFQPAPSRSVAREALGWPLDRPILVSVRRLAATKGLDNLIEAMTLVRRSIPDVLLILVGAGPLRETLERQVGAAGLEDTIHFAGQLNGTLPLAYRAADLSVVPSVALEGFGLSVVESLASGTPAMVTPVTGLPEVVRDLDPNLIFESAAPQALAAGMIAAITGALALPSEAACTTYVKRFEWRSIAERIAKVYEEIL